MAVQAANKSNIEEEKIVLINKGHNLLMEKNKIQNNMISLLQEKGKVGKRLNGRAHGLSLGNSIMGWFLFPFGLIDILYIKYVLLLQ